MPHSLTHTESAYLKAAYELGGATSAIPPSALSRFFDVNRVSALEMLRRLSAKGYGSYHPHEGLVLTALGVEAARAMIRKHRLFECLLYEKLGVARRDVCAESEDMELLVSDRLASKMEKALGHPHTCPCGKPIDKGRGR